MNSMNFDKLNRQPQHKNSRLHFCTRPYYWKMPMTTMFIMLLGSLQ